MKKTSAAPAATSGSATITTPSFDRRLVIAACPKGSSGKSTTLAALIEWYLRRENQPALAVFDPDTVHHTLSRIFGRDGGSELQAPHRVEEVDWRDSAGEVSIDKVVRVLYADRNPAMVSVVDGVANQMVDVMKWSRSVRLFEMAEELNFRVTFVVIVDEVGDTVLHARALFDEVGDRADYVIVRNEKKLATLPWDSSAERTRAREALAAIEVTLKAQTLDVQRYLDGQVDDKPHSLFEATQQGLDLFVRRRATSLWESFSTEMEAAEKLVLPPQFWRAES